MNCTHSDHQGKKIESICLNSECDLEHLCCKKCEKELHKSHMEDCFDLEDDFDEKFQKMVSIQNSLIKKLQSLTDTISVKSGKHIKQLQYDLNTLHEFGALIKNMRKEEIKQNILKVKHLNFLQKEGENNELSKIQSLLIKLDEFQEELNEFLIVTLNPSIKLLREALILIENNELDSALRKFDKAIEFDISNIQAYSGKAQVLRIQRKYKEAQETLDKGLQCSNNNYTLQREYGCLLLEVNKSGGPNQDNFQNALDFFQKSLETEPDNVDALNGIGYCLLGLKRQEEAKNQFWKIIKQTQNYHSFIGLVKSLKKQGDIDKLRNYHANWNNQKNFKYNLSEHYYFKGKLAEKDFPIYVEEILSYYDNAIKANPKYVDAYLAKAKLITKKKDYDVQEVLLILDEVFKIDPNNFKASLLKGYALIQQEKFDQAKKIFSDAIELYPNNQKIKLKQQISEVKILEVQISNNYPGFSDFEKLREKYEKYQLNDINEQLLVRIGEILSEDETRSSGNYQQAIEVFEYLKSKTDMSSNCKKVKFMESYCYALLKGKQYQKVIENFDKKFKDSLRDSRLKLQTYSLKGDALFELKQLDEAITAYDSMLYFTWSKIKYDEKIGNVLFEKKQYEEAIKYYENYLEKSKNHLEKILQKIYNESEEETDEETEIFDYLSPLYAYIKKSQALFNLNKFDSAQEYIHEVLNSQLFKEINAMNGCLKEDPLNELLDQIVQKHRYKEEKVEVNELVQQNDDNSTKQIQDVEPEKPEDQALSLLKEKKFDQAKEYFVRGLKANSQNLEIYLEQFCQILLSNHNYVELLQWIEEAIKIDPKNKKIHSIQIDILTTRIKELIAEKNFDVALDLLKQINQLQNSFELQDLLNTNDWNFQIGKQLFQEQNYHQAQIAFEYYLDSHQQNKNKKYYNMKYLQCLSLYKQQNYQQVLKNIEEIEDNIGEVEAQQDQIPPEVYRLKGDTLFKLRQYTDAQSAYDQALEQRNDSQSYFYYINIGDTIMFGQANKNRFQSAIKKYDKVLEQTELDQDCINTALLHKGYALFSQKNFLKAEEIFEQLIISSPQNASAYYFQSETLKSLNRSKDAQNKLDMASKNGLFINEETIPKLTAIQALQSDNLSDIQLPFV